MPEDPSVARLLSAVREGDERASDDLFAAIYDELHRLAHHIRGRGTPDTLNTTALVHEAYLHLRPGEGLDVESKRHFFRIAARAMRQVLARAARQRNTWKRGGRAVTVSFDERTLGRNATIADLLTLEEALRTLDRRSPRMVRIVECRFYAGLSIAETAQALDISTATVKRDWRAARAWLLMHLSDSGSPP